MQLQIEKKSLSSPANFPGIDRDATPEQEEYTASKRKNNNETECIAIE
jgi:hypothetical protein